MSYLLLFAALVVFVLGFKRSAELAYALKDDPVQRRNLLLRIAGFLAMSAWLHALPSILITIYMRHEGILASEVLTDDGARTTVVGLYILPAVTILTLLLTSGALVKVFKGAHLSLFSVEGLMPISLVILLLFLAYPNNIEQAIFLLSISVPFSIYIVLSLATSLENQIRFFWLPFAVIAAVTCVLLVFQSQTHRLVSSELYTFRSGGGNNVQVTYRGHSIMGRLILLTQRSAYIKVTRSTDEVCVARIPAAEAIIATYADDANLEAAEIGPGGLSYPPRANNAKEVTVRRPLGERRFRLPDANAIPAEPRRTHRPDHEAAMLICHGDPYAPVIPSEGSASSPK